jgi:Calcium binding
MSKPKKDHIREERIQNEAVVDAYEPVEQAMGWHYYLENKLRFPFQAKCLGSQVVSPLRKGETVEVRHMAPEDACPRDMLVLIRW